jgi:hypothetical protein
VRVEISADPLGARQCWCRDCQYIASGSATVNVLFAADAVAFAGDIGLFTMTADSGNTVERGFCKTCGAQLYSKTTAPLGLPMRLRAGLLDDQALVAPSAIIWASRAPHWMKLDPALPHHGEGPDSPLIHEGR